MSKPKIYSYASEQKEGMVKPDGTTITIDESGNISSSGSVLATYDKTGISKPDKDTIKITKDGKITAIGLDLTSAILAEDNLTVTEDYPSTQFYTYTFPDGSNSTSVTCPATGICKITCNKASSNSNGFSLTLYKNGTQVAYNSFFQGIGEFATIKVSQGDVLKIAHESTTATVWCTLSGSKVVEIVPNPKNDFLTTGEIKSVGPTMNPSGIFELDTIEGRYKLNLNIPQNVDCLINGIPDYDNPMTCEDAPSDIYIENMDNNKFYKAPCDGLAYIIYNTGVLNTMSNFMIGYIVRKNNKIAVKGSSISDGANLMMFPVYKGDYFGVAGNVNGFSITMVQVFPFKAPEYNMPIGMPDLSDGKILTYTTSGNNHTAMMPFDGYVIAMIYHGAANSSMCPTYFRVNDIVVGGVGQATYANGYIVYQSFAKKGDTLLFYFEDSKFTQKSITAYSLKPVTDNPQLDVYTENEQIIGKWIDGRFIYRKVYTDVILPKKGESVFLDGPENLEMEIKHAWFGESQIDGLYWDEELAMKGSSASSAVYVNNKNSIEYPEYTNKIVLSNWHDDKYAGKKSHFILEYVKYND